LRRIRVTAIRASVTLLIVVLLASSGCRVGSRLKEFTNPAGGFAVQLPGAPEKETTEIDGAQATAFTVKDTDGFFSVQYKEGPKLKNPTKAEVQEYFEQWRKNYLANTDAKVTEDRDAALDNNPGHYWALEIAGKPINQQVRVILANSKTYVIMAIGSPSWRGWRDANGVFNSFRLVDK
jgi:hypothetical protein